MYSLFFQLMVDLYFIGTRWLVGLLAFASSVMIDAR